jgi:hypothetical protein
MSWRWMVSFTPRPLYPRGKSPRYPLYRRLGGFQSPSGRRGYENARMIFNFADCYWKQFWKYPREFAVVQYFYYFLILSGVSPLGTAATTALLYEPHMIDDGDCRAIGRLKFGKGNQSTQREPALALLCQPQIPHVQTRSWTRCSVDVKIAARAPITGWLWNVHELSEVCQYFFIVSWGGVRQSTRCVGH